MQIKSQVQSRFNTPLANFLYTPLDGNTSLPVSSFSGLPCEQWLPNWPGWTDSLRPPCDCMSVRSPGRLCAAWEQHNQGSLQAVKWQRPYSLHNNFTINLKSHSCSSFVFSPIILKVQTWFYWILLISSILVQNLLFEGSHLCHHSVQLFHLVKENDCYI